METRHLAIFVAVAHGGSFAAAARFFDMTPSAISKIMTALEAELATRLFHRSTRALSLTEAGRLYLQRVESILAQLEDARDQAHATSATMTGTLRLTTSVAYGQTRLVPLLSVFRNHFPALKLELIMTDANVDLVAERIDLAIRLGARLEGDLISTRLHPTRYHVVAAPSWKEPHGPLKKPEDLTQVPCLCFDLPDYRRRWLFRNSRKDVKGVLVTGDMVISNALALREAALAGLGPALLADWLVHKDLERGVLVNLFPKHQVTATDFDTAAWLVYPSRHYLPQKVRAAQAFFKEHLGTPPETHSRKKA